MLSLEEALIRLGDKASWLDESTYKAWNIKALFNHPIYGEWWTLPSTVAKGHEHPSDGHKKSNETNIQKYGRVVNYVKQPEDITGKKYGELTVIKQVSVNPARWECYCSCGKTYIVKGTSLRIGKTTNCGCQRKIWAKIRAAEFSSQFIGIKYSKWEVIAIDTNDNDKLICRCDCGTIRSINRPSLIDGRSTNCGCNTPIYKTEEMCRKIIENITEYRWPKKKLFKNPETGFYLELDGYCKELNMAFEYDGEQHYSPISFGSGDDLLADRQKRDLMKNECCSQLNIILLRIPFTSKNNLEEYIVNLLISHKILKGG